VLDSNTLSDIKAEFDSTGYVCLNQVLPEWIVQLLFREFDQLDHRQPGARFAASNGAVKSILAQRYLTDIVRYFRTTPREKQFAIRKKICVVRSILFQKTPDANWFVPWHQDRTVALKPPWTEEQVLGDLFRKPTQKDGVWHFEASHYIMNQMVTARIHVDTCTELDGILEIIEGSHKWQSWRSDDDNYSTEIKKRQPRHCVARRGDIHLMHPLLVHRSRKSTSAAMRRVLQLEMINDDVLDLSSGHGEKVQRIAEWAHAIPFPDH
jgi:ectoine hydroxylase-related dioxygenase (phytanoyl-CoA dioxygenase family)